ncbi:MAG TPA: glycerophosphodiester phosphodiesterase [Gemmatimonadaceae bacterium]|nr:glycerophosphodiester phosphodiesterase [Gemmatimonadaceae bacterium]
MMLSAPNAAERIAHRGSPRERTENTLPGFLLALEHGADAVELDVHVSGDGEVVVHHDFTAAGTVIASTPWSALEQLALPGGARIPTLRDVLHAIGDRATVYVELKGAAVENAVIPVVREHGRRYALHSFDHAAITRCATAAPDIARGVLIDGREPRPLEVMRAAVAASRPRDVWPHYTLVDHHFMEAAGSFGLRVIPWTVNARDVATRLLRLGVAGICTDDVRLLHNLG